MRPTIHVTLEVVGALDTAWFIHEILASGRRCYVGYGEPRCWCGLHTLTWRRVDTTTRKGNEPCA